MRTDEFKEHKDHSAVIDSAYLAVESILKLDLYPAHKRELLDICIWKITEVDGKYTTRYRSRKAINNIDNESIQHEHVVEKKKLITELIENPGEYRSVLDKAVACVVTKEEHISLSKVKQELSGWDRYKEAGIIVYDCLENVELEL